MFGIEARAPIWFWGGTDLAIYSSSCDRHGGSLQERSKISLIRSGFRGVSIWSLSCCMFDSSTLEKRGTLVMLLPLWVSTDFLAAVGFRAYSSIFHGVHEDDAELMHILAEGQPICFPLSEAVLLPCGSHRWWRSRRIKWLVPRRRRGVSEK